MYIDIHETDKKFQDNFGFIGIDYSSTGDSSTFITATYIDGEFKLDEISRKDYYIEFIKEQSFY